MISGLPPGDVVVAPGLLLHPGSWLDRRRHGRGLRPAHAAGAAVDRMQADIDAATYEHEANA
jgi:hypothetical protein